jgi:signal transduction histidine kinase
MTEADVQRIFDPFWRGAKGATGMGVVLTIVKRAAGLLGHEIAVDSVPGRGTSFTLKIRLDAGAAVARRRAHQYSAF